MSLIPAMERGYLFSFSRFLKGELFLIFLFIQTIFFFDAYLEPIFISTTCVRSLNKSSVSSKCYLLQDTGSFSLYFRMISRLI